MADIRAKRFIAAKVTDKRPGATFFWELLGGKEDKKGLQRIQIQVYYSLELPSNTR